MWRGHVGTILDEGYNLLTYVFTENWVFEVHFLQSLLSLFYFTFKLISLNNLFCDFWTEAEQLLQNSNIKRGEENLFVMKSTVKNLLNAVADKNDPDLVEKFLSILQSKQYIEVSSFILGSVIKAYLNR